jgi:hypothetical protein
VAAAPLKIKTNGSLFVDIRTDNGAIDKVTFGGSADWYNPPGGGLEVSDWALQMGTATNTFRLDTTQGSATQPVTVTTGVGTVTATGTYRATIAFTREYSLVPGLNVVQTILHFTNNGSLSATIRSSDVFFPHQGFGHGAPHGIDNGTFADIFTLGSNTVAQASESSNGSASGTPGLTVILGSGVVGFGDSLPPLGHGVGLSYINGLGINSLFSAPFDPQGAFAAHGMAIAQEFTLAPGQTGTGTFYHAYGNNPTEAQNAFLAATGGAPTAAVPEPSSFLIMAGLAIFGLAGWRSRRQSGD